MQETIIKAMRVLPKIDIATEIDRRVQFIKKMLIATNQKSLVLGISGGQDSTLTGKLCQMAVDELNLEAAMPIYTFIALRLPYGIQRDEQDCLDALSFIKPTKIIVHNIKKAVDACVDEFMQMNVEIDDFNKGNIKARQRMIAQYAVAGMHKGLVVGTDHSSEAVTGFFTKFGDGGFDLAPLFGLNKRQGKYLLENLQCPEHLYHKVPTADLEEKKPGLPDEEALGVCYEDIDDFLEGKKVSESAEKRIIQHYQHSAHKRKLPVTLYDLDD